MQIFQSFLNGARRGGRAGLKNCVGVKTLSMTGRRRGERRVRKKTSTTKREKPSPTWRDPRSIECR
jgi:hypothetical protein